MSKKSNVNKNRAIDGEKIPDDAIQALARCLYPAMVAYFQSEEGQREFAEWQANRDTGISLKKSVSPSKKATQVA